MVSMTAVAATGTACEECGRSFQAASTGRPRRYCGQTCRKRASRRPKFPEHMRDRRRWVRAAGKRPLTTSGRAASSTNPTTWSTLTEVQASAAGDGYGFMLGGGIGCYDLDAVSATEARDFIAAIDEPVLFCETSLSGRGVHVFVAMPEARGSIHYLPSGARVERYSYGRFIRTTGHVFALHA